MSVTRTQIRPTRRAFAIGGGAFLLFLVGTNVQAGWVLVVAALMLGILIAGLLYPLRGLHGIEVSRDVPRAATAGQRVPVGIAIRNASGRMRMLVRASDDFCGTGWALAGLLFPGQTRDYIAYRTEARRGVYAGGTCVVETGAPFGVLRVRRTEELPSPIVVYPKTYDLDPQRMTGPGGWAEPAAVGDVSSVRDYRPGDPLRHIHWRSVARRGQLVVREFDHERHADVAILAQVPSDQERADAIASIACSLALAALSGGREVLLMGSTHGVAKMVRARTADAVLDWGARLETSDTGLGNLVQLARDVPAAVCVCTGSDAPELTDLASRTRLLAVLVGTSDVGAQLTGAGADVAEVGPDEVETWFKAGCPVS